MPRRKQPENFYNKSRIVTDMQAANAKPVVLKLPAAHPKQYELITALDTRPGCRFVVGACGTKFGALTP